MTVANDKPCQGKIERALAAKVSGGDLSLPAYPAVVMRLRALLSEDNFDAAGLAAVVQADSALAAAVVRSANAAARAAAQPVVSLRAAIGRVGVKQLAAFALASSLGRRAGAAGPLSTLRFRIWRDGLIVAHLARILGPLRRVDAEEAFLAGLLHNFGRVVVVAAIEELIAVDPTIPPRAGTEWRWLVASHASAAGLALARAWRLPEQLCEVIAGGHGRQLQGTAPLVELVGLAEAVTQLLAQRSHLTLEDLAALPWRSASEKEAIWAAIEVLPAQVAAYAQDASAPPPSHITPAGEEFAAETDFEVPVGLRLGTRLVEYVASRVRPDGLHLFGATSQNESALVQLVVEPQGAALVLWCNVVRCEQLSGGYRLQLCPFGVTPSLRSQWLAFLRKAGQLPDGLARPDEVAEEVAPRAQEARVARAPATASQARRGEEKKGFFKRLLGR